MAAPVIWALALLLVMVTVRVLTPPAATVFGAKFLVAVGTPGAAVFSLAVAVKDGGAFALVTALVVLSRGPALVAWTLVTVTVQLPLAGIVRPVADRLVVVGRVAVPAEQVVATVAPVALTSPAGYGSVKVAPVIATVLLLATVMVIVVVAPIATGLAPKVLVTVGATRTFWQASTLAAVPPVAVVVARLRKPPAVAVPPACPPPAPGAAQVPAPAVNAVPTV